MRIILAVSLLSLLAFSSCVTKRTVSTNGRVTNESVIVKGPVTQTVFVGQ